MDGILHNSSQDQVYDSVGNDMVTQLMEGYNGMYCLLINIIYPRKLKRRVSKILFGHHVIKGHSTQTRITDLLDPDQCDLV